MTIAKLKDRSELVSILIITFESIKHDKDKTDYIKNYLKEYKVLPGKVQRIINKSEEELPKINEENKELMYLLAEVTSSIENDPKLKPNFYFTDREMREIRTNYEGEVEEKLDFPFTFSNVIKGSGDNYIVYSDGITIKELYESQLLQYNFETQREARQRTNKKTGEIIEVPKVIENSVKQIESLIEKNKFDTSMITLNARLASSDEIEELVYDDEKRTLTVTRGTLLDVLDGFHRINGIVRALRRNPSINPLLIINIVNYDKKRAQEKFVQINTTNPISNSHKKKISEVRWSDLIARLIQSNSELNNKVSGSDLIAPKSDLLVTFSVLSDAIDEFYEIDDKPHAMEIFNYLKSFIDKLCWSFPDEFLGDVSSVRENSLINSNVMFYGYILLSKKMHDEQIDLEKIEQIVQQIDFSRDNPMWLHYNVIDDQRRVRTRAKKGVIKVFEEISLL